MTFAKKIFIAVFLSTLTVGSLLIWSAHRYVASRAETDFIERYTAVSKILADALTRLDRNTEALMLNAAQVVAAADKEKGLLSTKELLTLQEKVGVTHLFIIDKTGRFIRSTNEDPAKIPNLFSFSPRYKKLLTGELQVEATPIIKPDPEPKPFKFLSIANHDRTRIIEVGIRLDFIANTLVEAVTSDSNVLSMSLYTPDGTAFGTFSPSDVVLESQKVELPKVLKPIESGDAIRFFTKVKSSHPECAQCDVSGTSINGEYYYVLESRISKAELKALQADAGVLFLFVGFGNGIFSWLLAMFLSRRLVRNIETAVKKVRRMKEQGSVTDRINLKTSDEISFLTQEFDRLLDSLEESQKKLVEAEKIQSKVELAKIIAHNIKSPVLAIEMMLPGLIAVPERMKRVLKNSVKEIKELSNKLKNQSDSMSEKVELDTDLVFLPIFLDDLVKQKELEYSDKPNTSISFSGPEKSAGLFVKASSLELKSVLSNVINNACESYGVSGGPIKLSLDEQDENCVIEVADTGAGIPSEYLELLGSKNISFKGTGTRGVGLMHAFKTVEEWGGSISITSAVGIGTQVRLQLPSYRDDGANSFEHKILPLTKLS